MQISFVEQASFNNEMNRIFDIDGMFHINSQIEDVMQ